MSNDFDPGALMGTSYRVGEGVRVRLRMLAASDARELRSFMRAQGHDPDSLAVARLRRYDPRRRIVLCARALSGGTERLIGVGSIELEAPEPELVVADERVAPGLGHLLSDALVGRARVLTRRRVA